ncbi:flagellar assembly protein FliW [Ruicaihuangia caeni]|uniref:Flagellar assembly protein FliW n=1 Tax=Ruicaihuangia caeni TaxID=3042517 RepID=A0AAW6T689_9MICO|nr:flagellar assembly protein FliW [Klugiella sp. YN-L-19]MDI2097864.1 flagellar assembly protein FliW [Klugiella sp. YN-L-19]
MSRRLRLLEPLPGLDGQVDYLLDQVEGAIGLYALRSASPGQTSSAAEPAQSGGGARLFVLDAGECLPSYSPELNDEAADALGIRTPDAAEVLVVVNPADEATTVNLLAPIVVNKATGAASQVILDDACWPLKAPLAELLG